MKKQLNKLGKVLCITLVVIIVLIASLILHMVFGGFDADSDIEALQKTVNFQFFECDNIIYKYETEKNEILLYTNKKGVMMECVLDKRSTLGSQKYKNRIVETSAFLDFNGNWNKVNKHLRYYIVENEDEIEKLDFGKYEPIITRIDFSFTTADGIDKRNTRWVCVIDEKGDGVLTVADSSNAS